jgi:uncharacterized protein YciI
MFLITLTYKKPLADVDRHAAEHMAFVAAHYASGEFLLSGRKQPRTGGVILAKLASRARAEEIVRADPFFREDIAAYEIVEFLASSAAPALASLKES